MAERDARVGTDPVLARAWESRRGSPGSAKRAPGPRSQSRDRRCCSGRSAGQSAHGHPDPSDTGRGVAPISAPFPAPDNDTVRRTLPASPPSNAATAFVPPFRSTRSNTDQRIGAVRRLPLSGASSLPRGGSRGGAMKPTFRWMAAAYPKFSSASSVEPEDRAATPLDREDWWRRPLAVAALLAGVAYLCWRWGWTLRWDTVWLGIPAGPGRDLGACRRRLVRLLCLAVDAPHGRARARWRKRRRSHPDLQ